MQKSNPKSAAKISKSQSKIKAASKAQKKTVKAPKRSFSVAPKAPKTLPQQKSTMMTQQQKSFMTAAPKMVTTTKAAQKKAVVAPKKVTVQPQFTFTPLPLTTQRRNMSVLIGTKIRGLVACDPRFQDEEVISMYNSKTGQIEPIIVAVPDISFEWLFSSPCDLHTFDVLPVVKDCIDPKNPVFESMDA